MTNEYVGKPIGARNLTVFPLLTDPEDGGTATYGPAQKVSRLINIATTPSYMEGMLESDDGVEDDLSLISYIDVTINASQLTDKVRALLMGHQIDEKGGILTTNTDSGPEVALAWKELLSKKDQSEANKYKYIVLYRGKFKEFEETANTITSDGITYQTHNLTARFYPRMSDNHIKYSIREDTPEADATVISKWFEAPQEYAPPTG